MQKNPIFFFNKFKWETELQVCHLPARVRMTWNMELSSREQNWSKFDKSNILSSTILTSSFSSARLTTQVFMQHWTISSHPSPVKWSLPNAVELQMLWSWRPVLKWDLLGSTSFWATTSFNIIHSHYSHLVSLAVLLEGRIPPPGGLGGTILYKSVLQLPKSHRDKVVGSVLHQVIALTSLCKNVPHPFARFISILETKHFWMSESWQTFQAPALLLAECWAVLRLGCCTVSFRLWNLGSVEMVLLQLHGMLLLSPTICQCLWLCRYKVCMPAWLVSALKIPPYCVQTKGSVPSVEEILYHSGEKLPKPLGEKEKNSSPSCQDQKVIKG